MINPIKHIAFLGPPGSYSHTAAITWSNYYFNYIKEHSCQKFSDILLSVEHNTAEYGVLPLENSSSGLVNEVCDLLLHTQLILIADITIPIQHYILVNHSTSFNQIQAIYSHPQPVLQCSKFLKNFTQWKIILCESSSFAIQTVSHLKNTHLAALGSIQGGAYYGLKALSLPQKIISNYHPNTTRFIILKHTKLSFMNSLKSNKIMLIISLNYSLKQLYSILKILQYHHININLLRLSKLKSFHKQSKNMIILEIKANLNNHQTQEALKKIEKIPCSLKIIGCYSSIS